MTRSNFVGCSTGRTEKNTASAEGGPDARVGDQFDALLVIVVVALVIVVVALIIPGVGGC